jgi:hypothetical protein
LINDVLGAGVPARDAEVGDGMTVCFWSDRQACTVIERSASGKTIVVQEDKATRTDSNGMSDAQSYSYEPNPQGKRYTARRGADGRYRIGGKRGNAVAPGRHQHYDFSF